MALRLLTVFFVVILSHYRIDPFPPFIKHPLIIKHTLRRILPKSSLPLKSCSELGGRVSRLQIPSEHGKQMREQQEEQEQETQHKQEQKPAREQEPEQER